MINLTSKQLRHAADLKEKIAALEQELTSLSSSGGNGVPSSFKASKPGKKKGMSAAGRARIAAAQKARWAKFKSAKPAQVTKPAKTKRTMSAAQKAKISAAAKKRWAKAKAAGKNSL
jgi:hypothetical protein